MRYDRTRTSLDRAEAGRQADAVPVSREAVGLYRELLALNHGAYLLEHVRSVAFLGNVLVKNSRFGEAVAPLITVINQDPDKPLYS
jgi:hypothetical protein